MRELSVRFSRASTSFVFSGKNESPGSEFLATATIPTLPNRKDITRKAANIDRAGNLIPNKSIISIIIIIIIAVIIAVIIVFTSPSIVIAIITVIVGRYSRRLRSLGNGSTHRISG